MQTKLVLDPQPAMTWCQRCAFRNASESGESDPTNDEAALAKRWIKAFDAART
jgi:hypothetical protein